MASNLPVIDLLNNLIKVNGYLIAAERAQLPAVIAQDPGNRDVVQRFVRWQRTVWSAFYASLLNDQIKAQAQEIRTLFNYKAATQDVLKTIVMDDSGVVPKVVEDCVDLASLISDGQPLVSDLERVAKAIQSADKAKLAIIAAKVKTLNDQFDQDEDKITSGSLKLTEDLVATGIEVGVAVGTEGEAIGPLLKGITKVGTDIINEIALTEDSEHVLAELIDAWDALDEETAAYAHITMVITKLDNIVKEQSTALSALASIKAEWSTVTDIITGPAEDWANGGADAVNAWSVLMCRVSFAAATQMIGKDDVS